MSSLPSWSKLGRSAEVEVGILLSLCGWNVRLSPGSRGPADVFAKRRSDIWLIQVKSSGKFGRLKGLEIKKLKELAARTGSLPVIALVQPWMSAIADTKRIANAEHTPQEASEEIGLASEATKIPTPYRILFHSLVDWTIKLPF